MEVSRITFTKETKDKMSKGLNKRQRGQLRFERLKEAEANGRLQKAKTRADVARLAGFTSDQYKTGYSWVMNMLTRKHLIEHISGMGRNGRAEYDYAIGTTPDYGMVNATKGRAKFHEQRKEVMTDKCHVIADEVPTVLAPAPQKITIKYGELSIELENIDRETTINMVTDMLDKVMKG